MTIKIKKNDLLYFVAIFLAYFLKGFGLEKNSNIYRLGMLISIILCVFKIVFDLKNGINGKKLIQVFISIIIFLINFIIVRDITLLITVFFFLAIRKTSLKSVLLIILYSKIMAFIINLLFVFLGIRENYIVEFYREGFIYRSNYGFSHANFFHYMYFSIVILILIVYFYRIKVWHLCLFLFLNHIIYNQSYSRTGYINTILVILVLILIKIKYLKNIIYFISKYISIFLLIFTYISAKLFDKFEIFYKIDKLLTGRLRYSSLQLKYGISIFGKKFINSNIIFDNSYSMMLIVYGIIITFIYFYLYIISIKFLIKNKIDSLILMLFIFSIYIFLESYVLSSVLNISLLVLAKIYFEDTKDIIEEFK